jgi:hypothetical protein
MCCFTRPVQAVNTTRIFARAASDSRQFVVYSMHVKAKENLAMVLPLPVKKGTDEKGVSFINLKDYPEFFTDLEKGFPAEAIPGYLSHNAVPAAAAMRSLEVVEVGDFEASFVPTEKDFARLDARFRLPEGAWKKLPSYQSYGFAVFKLKPGLQSVQPMAFSFPRQDPAMLFFPTVHIHDGKVHATADFDHILYCQPRDGEPLKFSRARSWEESRGHARDFMDVGKSRGVVEAEQHCYKTAMDGDLPNKDTVVALEIG